MDWLYKNLRKTRPAQLAVVLKTLLRIKRKIVQTSSGHWFWIDPVSHFGGEILENGLYETSLGQLLSALLQPGDTFIDVGANEGYFSILGSTLVGDKGTVFSVEPQSRLSPVICKNLELNAVSNVKVFQEALSETDGELMIYLSTSINSGGSSIYRRQKIGAEMEKVRTESLDSFFTSNSIDHVRLIKLDCEGAELPIVKGAHRILTKNRVDFVSVDFHPGLAGKEAPIQIDRIFRDSGYHLSEAGNGLWVYHLPGLDKMLLPLGPPKEVPPFST